MSFSTKEFEEITREFYDSSTDLLDAAMLCDEDDIKIDMIRHLHPEIEEIMAREAALGPVVQSADYYDRDFVLTEMKAIAEKSRDVAGKIRNILGMLH